MATSIRITERIFRQAAPAALVDALDARGLLNEAVDAESFGRIKAALGDAFVDDAAVTGFLDNLEQKLGATNAGLAAAEARRAAEAASRSGSGFLLSKPEAFRGPVAFREGTLDVAAGVERLLAAAAKPNAEKTVAREAEAVLAEVFAAGGNAGLHALLSQAREVQERQVKALPLEKAKPQQAALETLARGTLAVLAEVSRPSEPKETLALAQARAEAVRVLGNLRGTRWPTSYTWSRVRGAEGLGPAVEGLRERLGARGGAVVGCSTDVLELGAALSAEAIVCVSPNPGEQAVLEYLSAMLVVLDAQATENGWSDAERLSTLAGWLREDQPDPNRKEPFPPERARALNDAGLSSRVQSLFTGRGPRSIHRPFHSLSSMAWMKGPDAPERLRHLTSLAKEGKIVGVVAGWSDPGWARGVDAVVRSLGLEVTAFALFDTLDLHRDGDGVRSILGAVGSLPAADDAVLLTCDHPGMSNDGHKYIKASLAGETRAALGGPNSTKGPIPDAVGEDRAFLEALVDAGTLERLGTPEQLGEHAWAEFFASGGDAERLSELPWHLVGHRSRTLDSELRSTYGLYSTAKKDLIEAAEGLPASPQALGELVYGRWGTPGARVDDWRRVLDRALALCTGGVSHDNQGPGRVLAEVAKEPWVKPFIERALTERVQPGGIDEQSLDATARAFLNELWTPERRVKLVDAAMVYGPRKLDATSRAFLEEIARSCDDWRAYLRFCHLVDPFSFNQDGRWNFPTPFTETIRQLFDVGPAELGDQWEALEQKAQAVRHPEAAMRLLCELETTLGKPMRVRGADDLDAEDSGVAPH